MASSSLLLILSTSSLNPSSTALSLLPLPSLLPPPLPPPQPALSRDDEDDLDTSRDGLLALLEPFLLM